MISTLTKALSRTASRDSSLTPSPTQTRRFTFGSLARRVSETKKDFFEQLPEHHERLRQRAKSLLPSVFNFERNSSDDVQNSIRHERKKEERIIINVDEIYRRINATHPSPTSTVDFGIPPPKLLSPSTIINENQSKQILLELPARLHGVSWKMVFSTEANGFSLNQLYRRSMENDQDTPALIFVKDVDQNIFGGYISQQLLVSEGFYGTGESFLFTIHPKFEVFHWTGNNQFFVKGDAKFLAIGSGGGTYGLWLDADLYHGRTCPSKTFNNVRLSTKEDFIIANVEVWTFVD